MTQFAMEHPYLFTLIAICFCGALVGMAEAIRRP